MLRKFLDFQLSLTEKGKPLHVFHPLVSALDTFLYEAPLNTKTAPHIRDAVDLKRWMSMVIVALLPCILVAIWNTGLQSYVYSSGDYKLMQEYLGSLNSLGDYFGFAFKDGRWIEIIKAGALLFFPVMLISYAVGGLVEGIFAVVRKHEIAEGFLVTGMLYPLILPPTIPYWMVAVGVAVGVIFSKEVFGGTGMNIMNPALACRAFLFFTFPGRMSGDVWVGSSSKTVRESLTAMNQAIDATPIDAYTQASHLAKFNVGFDIKRIHVDAIASNHLGDSLPTFTLLKDKFQAWASASGDATASLGSLSPEQLKGFVTSPLNEGGLGLSSGLYENAYRLANLNYGLGPLNSDWSFFLGNKLGCFGETSVLACLIGAFIIIFTRVGSWKTMAAVALGAFVTALGFEWGAKLLGHESGVWNPALFALPAYKHLLLGGLAFGLVYMATDPVSSPTMDSAKWFYGFFIGAVTIVIRVINPAYPEGVMLSIIMANVFAPLFDYYAALIYRWRGNKVRVQPQPA